jgi:DNA processing protein
VAAIAIVAERTAGQLRGGGVRRACALVAARATEGMPNGKDEASAILRAMSHDPVNLDQLCRRTGLTVAPLSAMLLALELEGKITAEHGRYTRRC